MPFLLVTCDLFNPYYNLLALQLLRTIKKSLTQMRENYFNIKTETPRQRTERIKRNRIIRKQKLYGTAFSTDETESKQTASCNRDEKNHIQKLKNRQAAQKSREQKKMYVTQLEEEIKRLKLKLSLLSHCQNCQKQLQIPPQQLQNFSTGFDARPTNQVETFQEEESQFMRVSSTEEHSSIGIYLFIFMIILGIFCIGTRMDISDNSQPFRRDLTQMTSFSQKGLQSALQPVDQFDLNMKTKYSTLNQVDLNPQSYQNGLLSMDQVKSPSLISDEKYFEKIITSFENYKLNQLQDKNLRSKVSLVNVNKSLMFCSRPKIYKSSPNEEGVFSAFIDIFVKGAQIINLFPQTESSLADTGNFQLNGLYKITASVQEIQEIGNPNFIY